jgi:hypothetical protein
MVQPDRIQLLNRLKSQTMRGDWAEICRRIKDRTLVPVIGNALRNDRIFEWIYPPCPDKCPTEDLPRLTVDEYISQAWAEGPLDYPLVDTTNLARVALYNRVMCKDDEDAKVNYLFFLKTLFLDGIRQTEAVKDPQILNLVGDLEGEIEQRTFSELVGELDYPRFSSVDEDPLRILARLELPIYITTSYYDFLERALEAEKRTPRTQICYWKGEPTGVQPEHKTDYDLVPSIEHPVVYHLFGWERYPATLVLSEGDYLDYLLRLISEVKSTNTSANHPIIPHYLREALYGSSLTLIGYRLQDWDFRVLYRLIRENDIPRYNVLVQVNPDQLSRGLDTDEVNKYLEKYFKDTFTLKWGGSEDFVSQLYAEFKKWIKVES